MSDKIILYSSNEAASRKTVTGWVSSNGTFFGDGAVAERAVRHDGCTHVSCAICRKLAKKPFFLCPECRRKNDIRRYRKMPVVEHDGTMPLYSEEEEEYFHDLSDAYDYADENGIAMKDLRLVICKPVFMEEIDEDYWEEDLAEGTELPAYIREAVGRLNKLLREHGPVSFEPGSTRPKL